MRTKFAEDVIPLTDLKTNPGKVVKHVEKNLAVFRHGVVERLVGGSEVFASRATGQGS